MDDAKQQAVTIPVRVRRAVARLPRNEALMGWLRKLMRRDERPREAAAEEPVAPVQRQGLADGEPAPEATAADPPI